MVYPDERKKVVGGSAFFAKYGQGARNAILWQVIGILQLLAEIRRHGLRRRVLVLHVSTKLHGFTEVGSIFAFHANEFTLVGNRKHRAKGRARKYAPLTIERNVVIQKQHFYRRRNYTKLLVTGATWKRPNMRFG